MPKQEELKQAGYNSLIMAIDLHGGIFAVAQRLGLQLSHAQHPDGYWDDFSNIERELFAYIQEHGTQEIMPSRAKLIKAGLGDLAGAFDRYGGSSAVASRLGLQMKIKPMGHWDDFSNVESALFTYIEEYGATGVMPTASELQKTGQNSLVIAMTQKHGGNTRVAQRLRLQHCRKTPRKFS